MRRNRANAGQPAITRKGVTSKTSTSARSVQSPSERIRASAGLAPSWSFQAAQNSQTTGRLHKTNSKGLAVRCKSHRFKRDPALRGAVTESTAPDRTEGSAESRTSTSAALRVQCLRSSEELAQVHARVKLPNLGLIAVEHQGLAAFGQQAALFTNAPLGGLTPARVGHVGIHIREEAVFLGSRDVNPDVA